ncbi:MAG: ABC transporter permease [Bacteroidia bacterium]|nr:ABC transporter permease [Bacteroidia bacterium]
MIWYNLKLIIRKIKTSKTFPVINIRGLTIGLTCCILAFLYIQDELEYDNNFKKTENIYRMLGNNFFTNLPPDINQPSRFMDEILKSIPEIESGVRLNYQDINIGHGTDYQIEKNVLFADSGFFSFFNWPVVQGDPKTVLTTPLSVVISQSKAKEYFGEQSPVGQMLKMDNNRNLTITGVFKDFPVRSHIRSGIIISFLVKSVDNPKCFNSWGCFNCNYYLKSYPNVSKGIIDTKLTNLWNSIKDKNGGSTGEGVKLIAQSFKDIYLKSGDYSERSQYSSITNIRAISVIAIFILIIVCFNFVNLTTAIMGKHYIEIGINKVFGAGRRVFMGKIIFEIALYILFSWILCFITASLLLPGLNSFLHKNLTVGTSNFLPLTLFILAISLIILFATSIYPIVLMNKTNISDVLKGVTNMSFKPGTQNALLKNNIRDSFVIVQFTFGILLILMAVTINKQMQFIRHRNLGFEKDQLVIVENPYEYPMVTRYQNFKRNIEKFPQVKMVSSGKIVPGTMIDNWGGDVGLVSVDCDYFSALGANFIDGRGFRDSEADKSSIIINEYLLKLLKEENPKGELPSIPFNNKEYKIIGVVKDIEFNTIHSATKPALFYLRDTYDYSKNIIIKLARGNISDGLDIIQKEWEKVAPNWPVKYYFMDEQFEKNYYKEAQVTKVISTLTIIALFLCCLGLFGLSLFTINGRIKEIGIRKVNGAKIFEVMRMLNKDFVQWVAIAFVIATPIAWYAMHKWLENFAYKTELSWWIFALSGLLVLGIALFTVSWQSWKAATRNPVEALRYE